MNITSSSGQYKIASEITDASTNTTAVKATSGQVYGWAIFNTTTSLRYVKLYNQVAAPNPAVDTPLIRIMVPPSGGTNWVASGLPFTTGIAYLIVQGAADTDATAVGVNDILLNLFYL